MRGAYQEALKYMDDQSRAKLQVFRNFTKNSRDTKEALSELKKTIILYVDIYSDTTLAIELKSLITEACASEKYEQAAYLLQRLKGVTGKAYAAK